MYADKEDQLFHRSIISDVEDRNNKLALGDTVLKLIVKDNKNFEDSNGLSIYQEKSDLLNRLESALSKIENSHGSEIERFGVPGKTPTYDREEKDIRASKYISLEYSDFNNDKKSVVSRVSKANIPLKTKKVEPNSKESIKEDLKDNVIKHSSIEKIFEDTDFFSESKTNLGFKLLLEIDQEKCREDLPTESIKSTDIRNLNRPLYSDIIDESSDRYEEFKGHERLDFKSDFRHTGGRRDKSIRERKRSESPKKIKGLV
ncbi:hypothetical protein AYI69_g4942 [Smittium culicis]|uniref:Uncharacterized protein n=1 Tax=Smittium culicis TaxID=133412 RepID=A0A1R1Y9D5_9FUNG|nr:hypothetical protein AYI69_g4942 [Smittium culicis]